MSSDWALHNSLKGWTLYNLSQVELSLLLSTLTANELKLARLAQKGQEWSQFEPSKYPELMTESQLKRFKSSEGFLCLDSGKRNQPVAADTEFFIVKPPKVIYERQHKRYEVQVPCEVSAGAKEFKTTSRDISEGGLFFKDLIPDWIAGYFIVKVNNQFELMCSIVEDQKEKCRVQIVSEDRDSQFTKFREWLSTLP